MTTSSQDVYDTVYNYLIHSGLDPQAAAGVMGNLQQESSMDPAAPGGGLAQWIGARQQALDQYAAQNGLSPNSLDAQLGYLMTELKSGQYGNINTLNSEPTPTAAADYFEQTFEKAGVPMMQNREAYANEIYNHYVNGQPLNLTAATSGSSGSSTSTSTGNLLTNPMPIFGAVLGVLAGIALIALGIWIAFNPFADVSSAIRSLVKTAVPNVPGTGYLQDKADYRRQAKQTKRRAKRAERFANWDQKADEKAAKKAGVSDELEAKREEKPTKKEKARAIYRKDIDRTPDEGMAF